MALNKNICSGITSGPSDVRSFVKFCNSSIRNVDIMWLDYHGVAVKYQTLAPGESVDVNTFVGHHWIFRDSNSGDEMVVRHQLVFEPPVFQKVDGRYIPDKRAVSHITIPVYSLRQRSLQILRCLIPKQQIKRLEIPVELQIELMEYYSQWDNAVVPNPTVGEPDDAAAAADPSSSESDADGDAPPAHGQGAEAPCSSSPPHACGSPELSYTSASESAPSSSSESSGDAGVTADQTSPGACAKNALAVGRDSASTESD